MGSIVIDEKYDKCRKMLAESISNKRYLHSIGVSNTAACLAMRYGFDSKRAYLAGLLHDCAKGLKNDELIATVKKAGMDISTTEYDNPELLHQKAGSVIAREKYGIEDEEILSAISYHTTGRPGMSLLEKIIFIADYIEPNREGLPELDKVRTVAFTDIDESIMMVCASTLDHLKSGGMVIDDITLETYRYYSSIKDKKEN